MPQFAANRTMLSTEMRFMDRLAARRAAGFEAVAYLSVSWL
jgi:hydroxypyruvate isomerase